MFSFGLTFKAYDWLVQSGIREVFFALGAVQIVVCFLTIPMCKLTPNDISIFHLRLFFGLLFTSPCFCHSFHAHKNLVK